MSFVLTVLNFCVHTHRDKSLREIAAALAGGGSGAAGGSEAAVDSGEQMKDNLWCQRREA